MNLPIDTSPFDLEPQGARAEGSPAVLLVHGLTGTPYDLRRVGEALSGRGLRARAIVLPGHERGPEELAQVTHTQWLDAVAAELAALRRRHARVGCVGLSLGGLLTLAQASEGLCDAIAIVGTPLRLPAFVRFGVPVMKHFVPLRPKLEGSDICDPEAKACNPGFDVMPLNAVHELLKLQRLVATRLARVEVPALVAHGARDRTSPPANLERIANALGSQRVERLRLARSAHVATVDYDGAELARRIAEFMAETLDSAIGAG